MTALELLRWYESLGLRLLLWERTGTDPKKWKGPRDSGWNAKERVYDISKYHEGMNVGAFTGHEIAPGRFLADIDFDWDSPLELKKALLPITGFGFGRPGKLVSHCFYTTPTRLPSVKQYKDLDGKVIVELFSGDSTQQTMLPPSLHSPDQPVTMLAVGSSAQIAHVDDLETCVRNYAIGCLLFQHFGHRELLHEPRMALAGFLLSEGLSEQVVLAIGKTICQHTGNDPDGKDMELVVKTTVDKLKGSDRKVKGAGELARLFGEDGKRIVALIKKWLGGFDFITNEKGKIYADSQDNIRTALDKLNISVSFNQFAQKIFIQNGKPAPELLEDRVVIPLWMNIERTFKFKPSMQYFESVIKDTAWRNPYHPVLNYLNDLKWDGIPRLDRWLSKYGGVPENDYTRAVGAIVLIAAVRRVRRPGCKFDEMLILESPQQGVMKSTALRTLCPNEEWFSDDLPLGADAKQIIERTAGKWLIEASELHGNREREAEHLKSFLSRQVDGPVRMAYDRLSTEVPRQFVIIGTTNTIQGYLKDFTGARRFWPVRIERFDIRTLTEDRDQIWAEAAHREANGESIRLREELYEASAKEQELRRLTDPWEDHLSGSGVDLDSPHIECGLVWDALEMVSANNRNNQHAERLMKIMSRYGYVKKKIWVVEEGEKKRLLCWVKTDITGEQQGELLE
jgi:hypothetical protein